MREMLTSRTLTMGELIHLKMNEGSSAIEVKAGLRVIYDNHRSLIFDWSPPPKGQASTFSNIHTQADVYPFLLLDSGLPNSVLNRWIPDTLQIQPGTAFHSTIRTNTTMGLQTTPRMSSITTARVTPPASIFSSLPRFVSLIFFCPTLYRSLACNSFLINLI
jgi:hypothetical protein